MTPRRGSEHFSKVCVLEERGRMTNFVNKSVERRNLLQENFLHAFTKSVLFSTVFFLYMTTLIIIITAFETEAQSIRKKSSRNFDVACDHFGGSVAHVT